MMTARTTCIFALVSTVSLVMTHFRGSMITSVPGGIDRSDNHEHRPLGETIAVQTEPTLDRQITATVTATMYRPTRAETDRTPDVLADGTRIDPRKASQYRYVALSRDLLKRWGGPFDFRDFIVVERAGIHSGVWQVRDTMHARWNNRIDFLQSLNVRPFKYDNVHIKKQDYVQPIKG